MQPSIHLCLTYSIHSFISTFFFLISTIHPSPHPSLYPSFYPTLDQTSIHFFIHPTIHSSFHGSLHSPNHPFTHSFFHPPVPVYSFSSHSSPKPSSIFFYSPFHPSLYSHTSNRPPIPTYIPSTTFIKTSTHSYVFLQPSPSNLPTSFQSQPSTHFSPPTFCSNHPSIFSSIYSHLYPNFYFSLYPL